VNGAQKCIPESLADEPTRKKLAKARQRTQRSLARKLKVTEETVRRYQKRVDLYLSILRGYMKRRGGDFWIQVEFPDQAPVILSGLVEDSGPNESKTKAKKKTSAPAKTKPKTRRAA